MIGRKLDWKKNRLLKYLAVSGRSYVLSNIKYLSKFENTIHEIDEVAISFAECITDIEIKNLFIKYYNFQNKNIQKYLKTTSEGIVVDYIKNIYNAMDRVKNCYDKKDNIIQTKKDFFISFYSKNIDNRKLNIKSK